MAKIKQITLPNGNTYDLLPDVLDGVTSNVQSQLNNKAPSSHTHNYAGSSSAGGAATSANKLNTNAGNATQPVYFEGGVPKATTYTLGKSVPTDAKFTDTTYSAGSGLNLSGTTFSIGSNVLTNNAVMQTTNPFGGRLLYISKIDNAFYRAVERWTVTGSYSGTITGTYSADELKVLFDGNYETTLIVPKGCTAKIRITFDSNESTTFEGVKVFPGYPYGFIYLSYYYTNTPSIKSKMRMYSNYEANGIGEHEYEMTNFAGTYSNVDASQGNNNLIEFVRQPCYGMAYIEFEIYGANNYDVRLTQIEMNLDRPNSSKNPFLSKYGAETLYSPLTAPEFIGAFTGTSTSATKLTTSAGSEIQPIYFSDGKPVATTYTLNKSVPSNAVFTDTTYSAATTSAAGLMSASDKTKLDGIATGANKYTLPVAGSAIGGVKSGTDITVDSSGNVSVNNDSHTHTKDTISSVNASAIVGTIPQANLPSYVDDVLEYNGKANFPSKGETGKIYVDTATNLTYRWGGSAYVEISPSLALGTTSSTAFRGDYGNTAYTHASAKGSAFSSGLYKITTNAQGHVTAATAVAKSDITGLGIPAQDTTYSASNGISLSGTTFSNSGVRSIATGSTNGTISVNTNGTSAEVAVKGLGSAAYTASTEYAASSHNHSASNITSGTLSVDRLPTVTIAKGGTGATTAAEALSNLGLTATAAELNYCDGVTSNIQTQFDTLSSNKADTSALTRKGVTVKALATSTYLDLGAYNVKKELTHVAGYVYFTAKSAINGGANLLSFSKPPLDLYYCPLVNITDGKITYATINTDGQLKNGGALTAGKVYIVNVSYFTDTE